MKPLPRQLGVTLELLDKPIPALALDSKAFTEVTHKTVSVSLVISGNHHESIPFLLISLPQTPLVLGYPWLRLQNPHVDWALGKIVGWSTHCHALCLKSALPLADGAVWYSPAETSLAGLTNAPAEYHDLCEVFSKSRARSLPPHRPYDCSINLLQGAPFPSS